MMEKARISFALIFLTLAVCAPVSAKAIDRELTNPLLRYIGFKELKPFKYKISALVDSQKQDGHAREISVYFRSLAEGMWFGINEQVKFCPASLLKVPVMMAYLKMAERDPGLLQKKFKYVPVEGILDQNITAGVPKAGGQMYSVDELIGLMIGDSDNVADGVLFVNIDDDALSQVFAYLGIDLADRLPEEDFVSIKTYAGLFRVLYNAAFLNKEMSQRALAYLAKAKFRDGIVGGVPADVPVAHKFGERFLTDTGQKQLHETAIVYYPGNAYILGIMTRGKDFSDQAQVIREISRLVYDEVDSQVKNWRAEDHISDQ